MEQAVKDVNFKTVSQLGDRLLDQLNDLRDRDPIYWSENQQAWIITSHHHVLEGFRGELPLSGSRLKRVLALVPEDQRYRVPYLQQTLPRFLISLDPPEQLRIRKLLLRAFSRKAAEAHRPFVRELIADTLAAAAQKGEIEFVEEVARKIPGRLILRLFGLSDSYFPSLGRWARASALAAGGATMETVLSNEAALLEMRDVFMAEIAERRKSPRDDFITALLTAEEDGDRLTDEDIVATCQLTMQAGHSTTTNTIALGVRALARDAAARDYIRANPDRMPDIIMEIMRFVAMSTAQTRLVKEDFEWEGRKLKKGDIVYLMIAAANRDPKVFEDPQSLDFDRPQEQNATFGPGLHHCIGHFLAKMQLAEFFSTLLEGYEIELTREPENWGTGLTFRGLDKLYLKLHARTAA